MRLLALQRFGKLGKRAGSGSGGSGGSGSMAPADAAAAVAAADAPSTTRDPRHMWLSLDEACTHVGAQAFRLVAGIYDGAGARLLGTAVSPPIRVLANNDVPTGTASIPLQATLPSDWEGWQPRDPAVVTVAVAPKRRAPAPSPFLCRSGSGNSASVAGLPWAPRTAAAACLAELEAGLQHAAKRLRLQHATSMESMAPPMHGGSASLLAAARAAASGVLAPQQQWGAPPPPVQQQLVEQAAVQQQAAWHEQLQEAGRQLQRLNSLVDRLARTANAALPSEPSPTGGAPPPTPATDDLAHVPSGGGAAEAAAAAAIAAALPSPFLPHAQRSFSASLLGPMLSSMGLPLLSQLSSMASVSQPAPVSAPAGMEGDGQPGLLPIPSMPGTLSFGNGGAQSLHGLALHAQLLEQRKSQLLAQLGAGLALAGRSSSLDSAISTASYLQRAGLPQA